MIWHGTDGSDGLETGIHLRWQFDPRLGFPLEGFYLHRRSNCSRTNCTEFGDFPESKDLPYEYIVRDGEKEYRILISSPTGDSDEGGGGRITSISDPNTDGGRLLNLNLRRPIEFRLPSGSYATEIDFFSYSNQDSTLETYTKRDESVAEIKVEQETSSLDGGTELKYRFPAFSINNIWMQGSNSFVSRICFSVCDDCEKPWEGPINAKCGFGLPIKIPELKRNADEVAAVQETTKEIRAERKIVSSLSTESTPSTLNSSSENMPSASKEATNPRRCVKFSEQTARSSSTLPNPYVSGQAKFEAKGQSQIKVDSILGTNGIRLQRELAVFILPSSSERIEAKIVHLGAGVRVEAYGEDGTLVDSKSIDNLKKRMIHPIILRKDGSKISKVIFRAPKGEAFLVEFCYYTKEQKEKEDSRVAQMTSDPEWKIATCRLPKDKWHQFQGEPFEDLKGILALMVEGAKDAPMGWRIINYKNKPAPAAAAAPAEVENGQETSPPLEPPPEPDFQISPMDLALISSINPYIARILGLYWVDTTVKDGEVYDYKIVANWPKGTLWNLDNVVDFEKETVVGKEFFTIFGYENFVFRDSDDARFVVDSVPSTFARAKKGLHSQSSRNDHNIKIHCTKPVKELQLFVKQLQGESVTLVAFQNNTLVDSSTLTKPEGVLAVHYPENIDYVILKSKDIIIYKICWDVEYIPHGQQSFTLCGVKKGIPQPLAVPTGLKLFPLPGMTKTRDDGSLEDHRFTAGLIWDIPKTADGQLLHINSPIMYHVQRRTPLGLVKWLTENSPVTVVPESFEKAPPPLWPKAWPERRMFYIDAAPSPGTYNYSISAVDIFGRISEYTNWASVDLTRALPPPPSDVEAKLLDPSDPSLTGDEKAWVTAVNRYNDNNDTKGLKVRWKWTQPLKRQAPDVDAFKIYLQPGWLNVVQGEIEGDPVENQDGMLELKTNYISYITSAVPDNVFAGEKMLMNLTNYTIQSSKREGTTTAAGKFTFIIEKPIPRGGDFSSSDFGTFRIIYVEEISGTNNLNIITDYQIPVQASTQSFVGQTLTIRQKKYTILSCRKQCGHAHAATGHAIFEIPKIYPRRNDFFSIPISHQKDPLEGGTFIDYRKASSWQQVVHTTEPISQLSGNEKPIEIIIPDPPLVADRTNKVVYAQIGISSVNTDGGEGSVSSPASILAVFREPPPSQDLEDSPDSYATIPNYYGKSSYALRWQKPATNDVRYFVYRAMDETLFSADNEIRAATDAAGNSLRSRDPSKYKDFLSIFNSDYKRDIEDKVIKPSPSSKEDPSSMDYVALSKDPLKKNILLQALASLPGNEKAFAKLHEQAIHPDDPRFANSITDVTPGGEPDPRLNSTLLLYIDETIDGRADNVYFYRLRTTNEIGALGNFGISTQPIYLQKSLPPMTPKIIAVDSGDKKLVIRWNSNYDDTIAGFVVYRTSNEKKIDDIRRMDAQKKGGDIFTVRVIDPSKNEYSFTDTEVEPRVKYYYRIVAVGANGQKSSQSQAIACEAIDLSPPSPPEWVNIIRSADRLITKLQWKCKERLLCIVERQESKNTSSVSISNWLIPDSFDEINRKWNYHFADSEIEPDNVYVYSIIGRNPIGLYSQSVVRESP